MAPARAYGLHLETLSITPAQAHAIAGRSASVRGRPNGGVSMQMLSGFVPTGFRSWLSSALALLILTGCATTRLAEEGEPSRSETLDVGYGTIQRDHRDGSVSTVYADEVRVMHPRTMIDLLARLPGVRVKEKNGYLNVLVRGSGPLYVVDGMIFRGSINSINPSTVESVSVLKNAGETAIYGSQVGHGGVILIKTKGGG